MKFRARDSFIDLEAPRVMGILNVTPDSFSDGGLYYDQDTAVSHAMDMIGWGASIIDVGGESTRPGAEDVDADEEIRRVLGVVEKIAARGDGVISIDTRKPEVAKVAVEAGASIINDTSGEDFHSEMDDVVRETGAGVIVMHSRGTPMTMTTLTEYVDVVEEVSSFLARRAAALEEHGIPRGRIAIDPGFGFAKTAEQSLALLNGLDRIVDLGYPVVAGTSRKSFIGRVLDVPEHDRLEGTAATVALALARGAHIVRVHDVKQIARVVKMTTAVLSAPR